MAALGRSYPARDRRLGTTMPQDLHSRPENEPDQQQDSNNRHTSQPQRVIDAAIGCGNQEDRVAEHKRVDPLQSSPDLTGTAGSPFQPMHVTKRQPGDPAKSAASVKQITNSEPV